MTSFITEQFIERAFALTNDLQEPNQSPTALEQKVQEATMFINASSADLEQPANHRCREFCIPVLQELTNKIEKVKSTFQQTIAPAQADQNLFSVRCTLAQGQALFIRGEKSSGLSWDKGIPMAQIEPGEWVCTTNAPIKSGTEYKFLVNDKVWEEGQNRKVGMGQSTAREPRFNAQEIATVSKVEASQNLVTVRCSLKEGNTLFIRGEKGGKLSWDEGIAMAQIQPGVWVCTTTAPLTNDTQYKFLVNDKVWEEGDNRKVKAGNLEARDPKFPAQLLAAAPEQRAAEAASSTAFNDFDFVTWSNDDFVATPAPASRMPSTTSLKTLLNEDQANAAANGLMKAWELTFTQNPEAALSMATSSFDVDCIQWAMQQNLKTAQENIASLKAYGLHELADSIERHIPALTDQYMMVLARGINDTLDNDRVILQTGQLTPVQYRSVMYLRLQLHKDNLKYIEENLPHERQTTLRLTQTIQAIESNLQGFVPSKEEQQEAQLHIDVVNLYNSLWGALNRAQPLERLSTYERDFFILHYFDDLNFQVDQVMPKLDQYGNKELAAHLQRMGVQFKKELLPALLNLSLHGTFENDQQIADELKALRGNVDARVLNAIAQNRIAIAENNAKYCPDIAPKPAQVRALYA